MSFGLTNAAAILQREVETALGDLLGKVCFLQSDEIIVFSKRSYYCGLWIMKRALRKFGIAGLKLEIPFDQKESNACFVKIADFKLEER